MLRFLFIFLLVFGVFSQKKAQAQDEAPSPYFSVTTKDRTEYIGQIKHQDKDSLFLNTRLSGTIALPVSEIKSIKNISEKRYERLVNSGSKRLRGYDSYSQDIQSQTGFGLKKGEVRYRNTLLFANDVEGGITDHISLQAGFTWTFLFPEAGALVWLQPKVSLPLFEDKVSTSLSFFYFRAIGPYQSSDDYFSLWQSSTSVRIGGGQFTVGLGLGKEGYELVNLPLFTLTGQIPLGNRTMLITENHFVRMEWMNYNAYSLAIRIGKSTNMDLGLGVFQDEYGDMLPAPVLQFRTPL